LPVLPLYAWTTHKGSVNRTTPPNRN
jgi:hypothetical protein